MDCYYFDDNVAVNQNNETKQDFSKEIRCYVIIKCDNDY